MTKRATPTSFTQKQNDPSYEFVNSHMAAVRLEQLEKLNSRNQELINTPGTTPGVTNTEVTESVPSSVAFKSNSPSNLTPQPDANLGIPFNTNVFPVSPLGQFPSNDPMIKAVA